MALEAPIKPDRVPPDPLDTPVQLNFKIPWHYREQLMREARQNGVSLTRYVVNALVRTYPPDRK